MVIVSDDWEKHVCYRMVLAQARVNIFVGSWKPILKEEGINTVGLKRGEKGSAMSLRPKGQSRPSLQLCLLRSPLCFYLLLVSELTLRPSPALGSPCLF